MYSLNKFVWVIANPLTVGCLMLGLGIVLKMVGRAVATEDAKSQRMSKFAWILVVLSFAWFWLWGTPAWTRVVGQNLERSFLSADGRMKAAADYPVCNAIVDLGGGCGARTNMYDGALLNGAADRAYFSALLWKAGKAPIIIASGSGLELADKVFMRDLGVSEEAIVVENEAMNTEGNAKLVEKILNSGGVVRGGVRKLELTHSQPTHSPTRILLVTSAWHMKRSLMMFVKYAPNVECVPAACDFECAPCGPVRFGDFLPDTGAFECNCRYFHEWLGIWGYKYFRR